MSVISFHKTFKALPTSFDEGAHGKVTKVKVRRRMGPVGPLDEGDVCVVKALYATPERLLRKVSKEVEVLRMMDEHENIVRIFAHWDEPPICYFAMELCDLGSPQRLLSDPLLPRDPRHALIFTLHIAKGLEFIHNQTPPLIHRDLKPPNVVLASQGSRVVAKIVDFGLATQWKANMTGGVGTEQYLSPEMRRSNDYCPKVDVFSGGIILAQLIVASTYTDKSKTDLLKEFDDFIDTQSIGFDPNEYFAKYDLNRGTSEAIQLACLMTAASPELRPSASEVCESLLKILPPRDSLHIPNVMYLNDPNIHSQIGRKQRLHEFRPLDLSRLEILTHLTLRNVSVNSVDLHATLKGTHNLVSLNLKVFLTDDNFHWQWNDIQFPKLMSFRLHERSSTEDTNRLIGMRTNVSRLNSMLFFGPLQQIVDNRMRVQVTFDSDKLIDIRFEEPNKFELRGGSTSHLRTILESVSFTRICLRNMVTKFNPNISRMALNPNHRTITNEEFAWKPGLQSACENLQLEELPLTNVSEGKLFNHFQNLRDLKFRFRMDARPVPFLNLNILPRTIRKLSVAQVTIASLSLMKELDSDSFWKLDSLHFDICEFSSPLEFSQLYHKIFDVGKLTISQTANTMLGDPKCFIPNCQFVSSVIGQLSGTWESMRFNAFDWASSCEEGFVKEIRKTIVDAMEKCRVPSQQQSLQFLNLGNKKISISKLTVIDICEDWEGLADEESDSEEEDHVDKENAERNPDPQPQLFGVDRHTGLLDVVERCLETLPDKFYFESPEPGPLLYFQRFPKSPRPLKHIHLRRCIVNGSTLATLLIGCSNLETLMLEMVRLEEHFLIPIRRPARLSSYIFHIDYEGTLDRVFTHFQDFQKFSQLFFFRGMSFLKGLWKDRIDVRIQKMNCKYLLIDHSQKKLLMEFMPKAREVFQEIVDDDDNVQVFTLHNCPFSPSLLPRNLTYLNFRHVEGVCFTDLIFHSSSFPSLKHLLYEAHQKRCKESVDLLEASKDLLRPVETLSLAGVTVLSLPSVKLKTLSLMGNNYLQTFEYEYPRLLDLQHITIVGDATYIPFSRTLYNLLTYENTSIQSATFQFFDFKGTSEPTSIRVQGQNEDAMKYEMEYCKSFFEKHGVTGDFSAFSVFREEVGWRAEVSLANSSTLMHQDELCDY